VRRSRRARLTAVSLLLLGAAVAACGASSPSPTTPASSPGPTAPATASSPVPVPSGTFVDGVVVRVVSAGLSQVTSFDLRATDGSIYTFQLSRLENGAVFPPGHLTEHQATAAAVRVYFSVIDQVLYATRLEDAPAPAAT
jgi:hypothetical protein